jgi:hypothetical protein
LNNTLKTQIRFHSITKFPSECLFIVSFFLSLVSNRPDMLRITAPKRKVAGNGTNVKQSHSTSERTTGFRVPLPKQICSPRSYVLGVFN